MKAPFSAGHDVHCTRCGEATQAYDGHHARCPACDHIDWNNPAPAVGVAILRGEEVLLAQRGRQPRAGMWDLVGGFIEPGESAAEAVAREVKEETGMLLRGCELVDVLPGDYGGRPSINILYIGQAEGEPVARDDVADLRWFPITSLPDDLAWEHEATMLGRVAGMVQAIKAQSP